MEFDCPDQSSESAAVDSFNESHSFSTQANSTFSEDAQVNYSAVEVSADDPNGLVAADVQRGADPCSSADEVSPSTGPTSTESSEENTTSSSLPVVNTDEELMTTTSSDRDSSTASPSGTTVDVAPVSVTLTADSAVVKDDACGDVDWRQSNSTESHCSSACSVDTVQSVQRQHVPDNVVISDNVIVSTEPGMTVDDGDRTQSTATPELPPSNAGQLPTPEEFVEEELPTTEFTSGITCSDVPTALDILNTRYRLADVTIHRNMITWSSWDIADMVRGPHRDSFWWKGKRRGRPQPQPEVIDAAKKDDNSIGTSQEKGIDVSTKDIEVLCEKIELKEREIELMLQRDEQRQRASVAAMPVSEADVAMETAQVSCSAPPNAAETQPPKKENAFQRLLRALRRRFSRQQQQQPSNSTQPEQRSGPRRLRTL